MTRRAAWSWLHRARTHLVHLLWAAFLLSLPFESSPLLPEVIGGRAVVRPLAVLPMMGLFFLEVLPFIWRLPWPRPFPALLAFWLVALFASLWGLTLLPTPEQGFLPSRRVVRGFMTLAVGSGFYLVTWVYLQRHPQRAKASLRWLYAALALSLLWGSLQVLYIVRDDVTLWETLNRIHRAWIGTRPLQFRRVSGVTYEPSWFAIQSLILFYPWLWGSVLTGTTVFPWRKGPLQGETLLLAWMTGLLLFTFSRSGLGIFLFLTTVTLVLRALTWGRGSWGKRVLQVVVGGAALTLFAAAALWGIYRWNQYVFEHFTKLQAHLRQRADEASLLTVVRILAGSRWGEWQYGYRVYEGHPVLGVGLGLAPFYLEEAVPGGELSYWFYDSVLPGGSGEPMMHIRHLYLRLLAETGWVGLWTFLAFQLGLVGLALEMTLHVESRRRAWGWCLLLAMAAVFASSIAFDSFSLPHQWVVYGWISGLAMGARSATDSL